MLVLFWNFWDFFGKYLDYFSFFVAITITFLSTRNVNMEKFILFMLSSFAVNSILKAAFRVPISAEINPNTFSFPSGNEQFTTIFCFGLWHYAINKDKINKNKIKLALCFCISVGINVFNAYFLVTQGYHTISDVFGGFVFGLVYLTFFLKVFNNMQNYIDFFLKVAALDLLIFLLYKLFFDKLPMHLIRIALFSIIFYFIKRKQNNLA